MQVSGKNKTHPIERIAYQTPYPSYGKSRIEWKVVFKNGESPYGGPNAHVIEQEYRKWRNGGSQNDGGVWIPNVSSNGMGFIFDFYNWEQVGAQKRRPLSRYVNGV